MSIEPSLRRFKKLQIQQLEQRKMLTGDFNGDGLWDVLDIDLLSGAVFDGVAEAVYDLNSDEAVNSLDIDQWRSLAAAQNGLASPYLLGDVDLDGRVGSEDLNRIGENWQRTDALWSMGDFDSDGKVSSADLSLLGLNWLKTSQPSLSAKELYIGPNTLAGFISEDFNGDGIGDLAVSNGGDNGISIALGRADGHFEQPTSYSANGSALMLAAHIDDDLSVDLISVSRLGYVTTLLGAGNGTFEIGPTTNLGPHRASTFVAHDLNGDGKIDLAFTGSLSNLIIAFGDGKGNFTEITEVDAELISASMVANDFDNDGSVEIAIAYQSQESIGVRIFGSENGEYSLQEDIKISFADNQPFGLSSLVAGDANDDGNIDLFFNSGTSVIKLLGDGDGAFERDQTIAIPWSRGVAVIDLNGDGLLDIASLSTSSSAVVVLYGQADGQFSAAWSYSAGNLPAGLATGDFNGDGRIDVATMNPTSGSVVVLYAQPSGDFGELFSIGNGPMSVATLDLNRDGVLDLATLNQRSNDVSVLLGLGDGTFDDPVIFEVDGRPILVESIDHQDESALLVVTSNRAQLLLPSDDLSFDESIDLVSGESFNTASVSDLDGDGLLDVAYGLGANIYVKRGLPDGSFSDAIEFELLPFPAIGFFTEEILPGDFNGDGVVDLAISNSFAFAGASSIILLWGTNDAGLFSGTRGVQLGDVNSLVVSDVNDDGISDLLAKSIFSSQVTVLLGTNTGHPIHSDPVGLMPFSFSTLDLTDVNGDGRDDLISLDMSSNSIELFLADETELFSAARQLAVGESPTALAVGDFDRDGTLDLAVSNEDSDDVSILIGNEDGTYEDAVHYRTNRTSTTPRASRLAIQRRG